MKNFKEKLFLDIVLFNSADVAYSTQRDNYLIDVQSDGSVMWMFPDTLRSYCRVDIKYFPFDRFYFNYQFFKSFNHFNIFKSKLYTRITVLV